MRTLNWLVVLAWVLGCGTAARGTDPFEQNRKLGRGVNIIGYDPIWRPGGQARFQEKYFRLLREAGFNCVRINLHPFRQMQGSEFALPGSWLGVADWAVTNALRHGVMPILDLHEYNAMGADPEGNKAKFLATWRQLADHFAMAPDEVLFEVLNEPSKKLTPSLWNEYLREALKIIREKSPERTVILGPAYWNSIDHLEELELPAGDGHLIVTVHYYKPMEFTHQGAAWANYKDKRDVAWLGTDAQRDAIEKDFDKAAAWAKAHRVPVFLGEFGAYDKGPMESRARWTAAVARAAEARGWSWAYWQFDSDFILYDVGRGEWVKPILQALAPKSNM